jgi:ParB-like chromosome segregation protein Spo0J
MPEQQPETAEVPTGTSTLRAYKAAKRATRAANTPPAQHRRVEPEPLVPVMRDDPAVSPAAGPPPAATNVPPKGSFAEKIELVAPNPQNTRDVSRYPEELRTLVESLEEVGQLHACPVISRAAYLKLFPEDASEVSAQAKWVQAPGGMRRAALIEVDRRRRARKPLVEIDPPTIDIVVMEHLAASRELFLKATLDENISREDLDPIELGQALAKLVEASGNVTHVAHDRDRSDMWVHHYLNLLKLHPDVQAQLRARGDARLPAREVRGWHRKDVEQQLVLLDAWRRRHVPGFKDDDESAPEEKPPKVPRFRAVFDRLRRAPVKDLSPDDRKVLAQELMVLAEELLREGDSSPE